NRSSRNFCIFGTQPIYLADHIFVARRRGEDVEAFDSGRRCRGLARAVGPAQGESARAGGIDNVAFDSFAHTARVVVAATPDNLGAEHLVPRARPEQRW